VTEVRHAPGEAARGKAVADLVPGSTVREVADVPAGTVHLVLGSDFNGIGQQVTEAPSPSTASASAAKPRTAADTGCIN
jgi:microsomal dipeptidase-like Zn-dependent dipeptidase